MNLCLQLFFQETLPRQGTEYEHICIQCKYCPEGMHIGEPRSNEVHETTPWV